MIERFAKLIQPILEFSIIRRTRRNHALEHATIHMLSKRYNKISMSGRSSDGGFVLIGNVSTEAVEQATREALERLGKGEHNWALHPNCGTNLVTAGALTTAAGIIGLRSDDKPLTLDRISWTIVLMMLAVLVSQPLGMRLQKYITTKADPGDLELVSVTKNKISWPFGGTPMTVHNISTRRG